MLSSRRRKEKRDRSGVREPAHLVQLRPITAAEGERAFQTGTQLTLVHQPEHGLHRCRHLGLQQRPQRHVLGDNPRRFHQGTSRQRSIRSNLDSTKAHFLPTDPDSRNPLWLTFALFVHHQHNSVYCLDKLLLQRISHRLSPRPPQKTVKNHMILYFCTSYLKRDESLVELRPRKRPPRIENDGHPSFSNFSSSDRKTAAENAKKADETSVEMCRDRQIWMRRLLPTG